MGRKFVQILILRSTVHREHGEDNSQITVGEHIVLKMLNMS